MTDPEFINPTNPAELAIKIAEAITTTSFDMDQEEMATLANLDKQAEIMGFHDRQYFVQAYRALSIPVSFDADRPVSYTNFMGASIEGTFVSFSKVHIGRLIGAGAVRAVCLTFNGVTLLPYFETLPQDQLLHIPVLAISDISMSSTAS